MGTDSKISWTHHTLNPWIGCAKVAPGCTHCYAEDYARRYGRAKWGPAGTRSKTADWRKPLKWNKEAQAEGVRKRVFCASLADVFEDWNGPVLDHNGRELWVAPSEPGRYVPWRGEESLLPCEKENIADGLFRKATIGDLRRDLFSLIDATPWLDWLLLTKRPENVPGMWVSPFELQNDLNEIEYRHNVWIGTSISDQETADRNVPLLLKCRRLAPVLFLSAEPLLGPVDLTSVGECDGRPLSCLSNHPRVDDEPGEQGIDWVIAGGESGPHARPMHPDWARGLRDQCNAAGVAFHFKQWGEWGTGEGLLADERSAVKRHSYVCPAGCSGPLESLPKHRCSQSPLHMYGLGKEDAGRLLDGRTWDGFPEVSHAT